MGLKQRILKIKNRELYKPLKERAHRIEVTLPWEPSPEFELKLDGKRLRGVAGVQITSALFGEQPHPQVLIRLWAKEVIADIYGEKQIIQPEETRVPKINLEKMEKEIVDKLTEGVGEGKFSYINAIEVLEYLIEKGYLREEK